MCQTVMDANDSDNAGRSVARVCSENQVFEALHLRMGKAVFLELLA